MKGKLKAFYDDGEDILYLVREGEESEFIEIQPGVNIELNEKREIIGIEIMKASEVLGGVITPLQKVRGSR